MRMEKRERERLDLKVKCRIQSCGDRVRTTWTDVRNISRSGLLVEWRQMDSGTPAPRVGEPLVIDLQLPENVLFGPKCLHLRATVVRVSPEAPGESLVAVKVHRAEFRSWVGQLMRAEPKGRQWTQ